LLLLLLRRRLLLLNVILHIQGQCTRRILGQREVSLEHVPCHRIETLRILTRHLERKMISGLQLRDLLSGLLLSLICHLLSLSLEKHLVLILRVVVRRTHRLLRLSRLIRFLHLPPEKGVCVLLALPVIHFLPHVSSLLLNIRNRYLGGSSLP